MVWNGSTENFERYLELNYNWNTHSRSYDCDMFISAMVALNHVILEKETKED